MTLSNSIRKGRDAFNKQSWAKAYLHFKAEDLDQAQDLEDFAKAAYLTGKRSESNDLWARAHQEYFNDKNIPKAVYCAFWLGMNLLSQGETAQGSGWMARANRLAKECPECPEHGLLLVPQALQKMREGNGEEAFKLFSRAFELGQRYNNQDLMALGRLGRGQALIIQKQVSEGTTLFDETMVAVLSEEISPIVAGIVYCAVIETCQKIYDLQRAREWTTALSQWCDDHSELIPFRGQCLVRRAEILQLNGEWANAIHEVQKACKLLSEPPGETATGEAYYRQGEIFRLQGRLSEALEMFRIASKWGRNPQPGLALLRLMQGQFDTARAAIQQLENEKKDPITRSRILPAYVEIMLLVSEQTKAQKATDELMEIASRMHADYLLAVALYTKGNTLLHSDKINPALECLKESWQLFNQTKAVYESARARILLGQAYHRLGDDDSAELEFNAAGNVLKNLGAVPDIERLNLLTGHSYSNNHKLTPRELDVLQLLATGKTNKEIASQLFISQRTVDRHVSNIFAKLNISSRSAATAFAHKHQLL